MERPKRPIEFTAKIGADTRCILVRELREIADQIEAGLSGLVCGADDCGVQFTVITNPTTPERYHEELNAWLERPRD